jgi:hypothetical protein
MGRIGTGLRIGRHPASSSGTPSSCFAESDAMAPDLHSWLPMKRRLTTLRRLVARISRQSVERAHSERVPPPSSTFYEGDDMWPDETTAVEPRQSMAELLNTDQSLPSV